MWFCVCVHIHIVLYDAITDNKNKREKHKNERNNIITKRIYIYIYIYKKTNDQMNDWMYTWVIDWMDCRTAVRMDAHMLGCKMCASCRICICLQLRKGRVIDLNTFDALMLWTCVCAVNRSLLLARASARTNLPNTTLTHTGARELHTRRPQPTHSRTRVVPIVCSRDACE